MRKSIEIIIVIIFIIFSYGLFIKDQFVLCFFTLVLIIILLKYPYLQELSINLNEGIKAKFFAHKLDQVETKFKDVIRSEESTKHKILGAQKLVDEIFALGLLAAGHRFNEINGVHIVRDKDGHIKTITYNEN